MLTMPRVKLDPQKSVLAIIDIQPTLSKTIFECSRVLERVGFLGKAANLLGIPIVATEQNPLRMGRTCDELINLLNDQATFSKMSFSAIGCEAFVDWLVSTGRSQVVLVGMETHICVSLTASDLLDRGFEVVVCPDAVSARTVERHKLGMERIRDAGGVPAHSESVVYEWVGSAESPNFKPILQLVKELPPG
jgi:nicotinamidase-related amidase